MQCPLFRNRSTSAGLWPWAALLAALLVPRTAAAQVVAGGIGSIPSHAYFNALPAYYDGDYQNALNVFLNESRASKTPAGPWIDAICYYTMAGECYYQLGQLPAALDSYNAALKLYLAYSPWMMRVQFPASIGPAAVGSRAAPWGQSKRGAAIGRFDETYPMGQGQLDQSAALTRGGVIQSPVMFPVHVSEICRCVSLSIRRRRELMGPVSRFDTKSDPLTGSLVEVLSRKPGPPNHWSEAWVSVQLGCAYAATGNHAQAKTALERGLLVAGQYDHPLTGTALVELGKIALETGDFPAAARYLEEATYACLAFPDPVNLEEAFRLGFLAHLLLNQRAPYPLLAPAIAWSKSNSYRHLQASLSLLAAENMSLLGEAAQAADLVAAARLTVGRTDLANSQLGARLNHLTALAAYQAGNVTAGDAAIGSALDFQRHGSLWLFQIALADGRYTRGETSDRVSLALYETLLRDPLPADWAAGPLECLSVLSTPHAEALEHWFEVAIKSSKEPELALEIADRARRHRFLSTLPLGGRLLSLRWVIEGPITALGEPGMMQRQDLLTRYPQYTQLAQRATELRAKLAAKPLVPENVDARREQAANLAALGEISQQQELILREIAVRREPAEIVFPPIRRTKDVQAALGDGQVLLAFFSTRSQLYAFLYSREKYAHWQVHSPLQVQKNLSNLLREMGNFDINHELGGAELGRQTWRTTANRLMALLLERSSVELAGNFEEIVIVPDAMLWYLPFEALPVGKSDRSKPLISQSRVRYAPTVGLAVPSQRILKPKPQTGVVLGKVHPQDDAELARAALEQLQGAVEGTHALAGPPSAASSLYRILLDRLIVLDDIEPASGMYEWSPMQLDRGKSTGALSHWFSLPFGGPEQLILPGFHTAAENGARKGAAGGGNEIFLTLCGLMSTGARTVLISRWRTGGQSSLDLVREFAQELPHTTPAAAWQRSVQVESDTPLDPLLEPRVKDSGISGEPKGDHPFFWAGYLLADCGELAEGQEPPPLASSPPRKESTGLPANPPRGAAAIPPAGTVPPVPAPAPDPGALQPADPPAGPAKPKRVAPKSPPTRRAAPAVVD